MSHSARRSLLRHLRSRAGGLVQSAAVLFLFLAIWLAYSADLWTRVRGFFYAQEDNGPRVEIVDIQPNDARHQRIAAALNRTWLASLNAGRPQLFIAKSTEINAASFGRGVFLFWEGVGDLPEWAIDAIAAHEVAHDMLRHSKKSKEWQELVDFFAEVLAFLGRSSREGETTLKGWMRKAALPKHSRSQEFEADRKAVELLALRRYENPRLVVRKTLEILLESYGDTGGWYFDNHPSTSERIEALIRPG